MTQQSGDRREKGANSDGEAEVWVFQLLRQITVAEANELRFTETMSKCFLELKEPLTRKEAVKLLREAGDLGKVLVESANRSRGCIGGLVIRGVDAPCGVGKDAPKQIIVATMERILAWKQHLAPKRHRGRCEFDHTPELRQRLKSNSPPCTHTRARLQRHWWVGPLSERTGASLGMLARWQGVSGGAVRCSAWLALGGSLKLVRSVFRSSMPDLGSTLFVDI